MRNVACALSCTVFSRHGFVFHVVFWRYPPSLPFLGQHSLILVSCWGVRDLKVCLLFYLFVSISSELRASVGWLPQVGFWEAGLVAGLRVGQAFGLIIITISLRCTDL